MYINNLREKFSPRPGFEPGATQLETRVWILVQARIFLLNYENTPFHTYTAQLLLLLISKFTVWGQKCLGWKIDFIFNVYILFPRECNTDILIENLPIGIIAYNDILMCNHNDEGPFPCTWLFCTLLRVRVCQPTEL